MPSLSGWEFLELINEFDAKILNQITIYILSSPVDKETLTGLQTL